MKAYAIFQGGGAKGFAHVGALRAAEERRIRFAGVAGTSIGAIIAALIAAGYSSDELYATDGRAPAGALDINPLEVINAEDWREIETLQAAAANFAKRPMVRLRDKFFNLWLRQLPFVISQRQVLGRLAANFGMTGTEGLVAWVDRLLSAKITSQNGGRVCFRDLPIPLRVVAADIVGGATRIFGVSGDEDMAVADAVAASACYPGVFVPVIIGGGQYVDGGLVSNLPAWVFDEERKTDPGFVPTFGIRFIDEAAAGSYVRPIPANFLKFIRRLLDTALSGASQLESRAIDDYYAVDLAVDVPTLSFSGLKERAPAIIESGRVGVLNFFETTVGPQDPELIRTVLWIIAISLRRRLALTSRVRTYVLMQQGQTGRAKVFYSSGMEDDPDDRMTLEINELGPAMPIVKREPVLVRYHILNKRPGGPHAKYERAMRPDNVVSAYSIPIFDDPNEWLKPNPADRAEPYACLVIDAEEDLRSVMLVQEVEDLLAGITQLVGEYVRDRRTARPVVRLTERENPNSGWEALDSDNGCLVAVRKLRNPSDRPETRDIVSSIEQALKM